MNEDMILPDDFQTDQPQSEEVTEQPNEPVEQDFNFEQSEPTEESQETETQTEQSPFLKIKYNKEEMELDEERARELAEMGMNYPKLREKLQALENDPRLSLVENLAQQQGMNVDEYIQAVNQYQEEQQLNELIQQNIPEEYAREMLESRRFREQLQAEQQQRQQEQQQQAEFADFFKYFKDANGRDFVPDQDVIPDSVWQANQQGVPLRYAYAEHENNQLRQQLATLKTNENNAKKAPVKGVTSHGSNETASEDPFLKGFNSF